MSQIFSLFRNEDRLVEVGAVVFGLVLLLGPIAIFPFLGLTSLFIKQVIFAAGAVFLAIIGLYKLAINRQLSLPAPYLITATKILVLCLLVSGLMAEAPLLSLLGVTYEIGTVASVLILAAFLVAGIYFAKGFGEKMVGRLLAISLGLSIFTSIYQLGLFILGYWINLSPFLNRLGLTTFVSWYESAIWLGLNLVIATLILSQNSVKIVSRRLALTAWVLALINLVLINFSQVWWLALIFLGVPYLLSLVRFRNLQKIPVFLIVTVVISIAMLSLSNSGQWLNNQLATVNTFFNRQSLEVRPNLGGTYSVAKQVYSDDLGFGVGPNNFRRAWQLYHPTEVNASPFWNLDFDYGLGFFSTLVAETGIVGLIGVLVFTILSLITLGKGLRLAYQEQRPVIFLVALASLYLFIFAFLYSTDYVLLIYTFALIGLVAGLINTTYWEINFRRGFWKLVFWPIIIIDLAIILIFGGWFMARMTSTALLGVVYSSYGGADQYQKAATYLQRAVFFNPYSDINYRTLALVNFQKASAVANDKALKQDEATKQFQVAIAAAVANANLAIKVDPYDFTNYMLAGQIYEALVPLKVPGAYDSAKNMYQEAQKLNPQSPLISFSLARLGLNNSQVTEAKNYLNQSLSKKPNFSQALLTLAQLDYQEGKLDEAKNKSLAAVQGDPNNINALLQLGYILYISGGYEDAVAVLNRAVALSPNQINANAQYFIGLSLAKIGKTKEALDQFKIIQSYNPENDELTKIINNLTAGREPLASAPAPVASSTPVKAKTTKTAQ